MALYIVATPIGNLEDITLRALRILKEVDGVVAEDTRQTQKLFRHFQIQNSLSSFFEHQEGKKIPALVRELKTGKSLALVTDAGTPGISDPGFRLIREAIASGIEVIPIPGPTASICALQASGLPTDHFLFLGFLPEKEGKRKTLIESLKPFPYTLILYLSRWKGERQVKELLEILGDRDVCLGREMTKKYEEFWRGSLRELDHKLKEKPLKGEWTLIIAGAEKQ